MKRGKAESKPNHLICLTTRRQIGMQLGTVKHLVRLCGAHGMDDPYYMDKYKPTLWEAGIGMPWPKDCGIHADKVGQSVPVADGRGTMREAHCVSAAAHVAAYVVTQSCEKGMSTSQYMCDLGCWRKLDVDVYIFPCVHVRHADSSLRHGGHARQGLCARGH